MYPYIHHETTGSGPAICLLHGWPTNAHLWDAQVAALKNSYKVITLDWPGFGRSDKPIDFDYSFTNMKMHLDAVLSKALAPAEKVTLVAHDIGGPPAILWASENEHRVERLILLNTVIYTFKTDLDALSERILHLPLLRDVFVSRFGWRQVLGTMTESSGPTLKQRIKTILDAHGAIPNSVKRNTLLSALKKGRENELLTLAEIFQKLTIDKYFVIAKKDALCYEHIQRLQLENPDLPSYILEDCGHFLPIDQPEEVSRILLEIMDR